MLLQLDPYQMPEPYPQVRRLPPDKELFALLSEGYSGAVSEMTTVLQYAYHSLRCQKRYREISETIRGIFYVETIHMELLGNCICSMGGEALYTVSLQEKPIPWQSALVEYGDSPAKMLLADIEGEKQAADYYAQTAAQAQKSGQPDLAALCTRLEQDERLHVRIFTDLYNRTFRRW